VAADCTDAGGDALRVVVDAPVDEAAVAEGGGGEEEVVVDEGTPRPGERLLASRVRVSDDDDDVDDNDNDDDDVDGGCGGGGGSGGEGEDEDGAKQRPRAGFGPRWRKRGYDRAGSGTGPLGL
jgi:hypothetical protein